MLDFLKEPSLRAETVGSETYFAAQKRLIMQRPLLKGCYDEWYEHLRSDIRSVQLDGDLVELGSGGSYLRTLEPELITSDVVEGLAEQVIDARHLPFSDSSVRALVLTHVLHHIPDVEAFFREAERVLVPGGVIAMVEVSHTPFARFFFRRLHPEPFDDAQVGWAFDQSDSMMDSNQALSWILFDRDRERFERTFPHLTIEVMSYTPWLGYVLSGGVTMRDLVPRVFVPAIGWLDRILRPLRPMFALHWHIRVRKAA